MTNNNPDRYTVNQCNFDNIVNKIKSANDLGLSWMMRSTSGRDRILLYVFFDDSGMNMYLSGAWNVTDSSREYSVLHQTAVSP